GMACRVYFCPSCRELPRAHKEIIRETAENWHQYGLIITEAALVMAFFEELEKRLGGPVLKEDILGNKRRIASIRDLLNLKIHWPRRSGPGQGLCNYFFEEALYAKPPVDYAALGARPSPHDVIFRELVSDFKTGEELLRAEERLERLFSRAVRSFRESDA
ncbi:MAG: hypothetical protein GY859_12480, partial [Desulfobacterales bacterium]|nr:hypothetical protein [Desulfobacterales bacterium]